jgi:hypothetical protein
MADDFCGYFGMQLAKTNLRLAQQTVVRLYPEAVKEWGSVIARFDSLEKESLGECLGAPDVPADKVEDSLAAWLDEMELEDGEHGGHRHSDKCGHGKVDIDNVLLYQCSWCSNPSAALKRCTGCGKARFVIYLRGRGLL